MLYEKKERKKRNLYIVIKKRYIYCYIHYIQKNKNTWEIYIKTETKKYREHNRYLQIYIYKDIFERYLQLHIYIIIFTKRNKLDWNISTNILVDTFNIRY